MDVRDAPTPSPRITLSADETVHAIVERYPESRAVFERFGVHVCCGGDLPLAVAAERDAVDLERLLAALGTETGTPVA